MKCAYKYCDNTTELTKEEAIKDGGRYYHLGCYDKKEMKNKIASLFFSYVKNNEDGLFIKKIISDYIDKEKNNACYVYFAMCYAVDNSIPLKSIFGLKYIMNQDRVKKKYNELLLSYQNVKIKAENVDYIYKKELKGGWDEMIG